MKGAILIPELPTWTFHDFTDPQCGKISHIAPDVKPPEGPAGYSTNNLTSPDSACLVLESSWNCPRSYVGTQLHVSHVSCTQCQVFIVSDEQITEDVVQGEIYMFRLLAIAVTMIKGWAPWHLNKVFSQNVDKRKEAAQSGSVHVVHKRKI